MSFKETHTFAKRKAESERVRSRYSDRIPIICEIDKRSNLPPLDKIKYLVPDSLTVGQFNYVIRKRIKLAPEKAMFLLINNTLPASGALISAVYEEHKDLDGFMYVICTSQEAFGTDFKNAEN